VAAAGAGKTHTMSGFARLWTTFTGRRVIGLATATNAARVLASEGLAESSHLARRALRGVDAADLLLLGFRGGVDLGPLPGAFGLKGRQIHRCWAA
jgi:hypothetical protein